jgi:hypothetical protein
MLHSNPLAPGLARAFNTLPNDFNFFVGNRTFPVPKFIAIILAPPVHRALAADPTLDQFTLSNISDSDSDLFEKLIAFSCGDGLDCAKGALSGLSRLARSVENCELVEMILKLEFGDESLSRLNAVERMILKGELGVDRSEEYDFLASNFFDISKDCWTGISADELKTIVSRPTLRLSNEDSLVELISTLPADASRVEVLSEVEVEFLSVFGIEEYLKLLSHFDLNECHWRWICRRLRRDVRPILSSTRFIECETIDHSPGHEFEGLLSHLKQLHGGNIRSAVSIEQSSPGYGDRYDLTNYGAQISWYTSNATNSWVRFDFKDRMVSMSSYSLKSRYDGNCIPRSWVVEGGTNDTEWTELDRHTNDATIVGGSAFHNFKCGNENRGCDRMFRYIRFRQTGLNSRNDNYLVLCNIEIFGRLSHPRSS